MKYFEIRTHHYAWSHKELEEFSTSFASSMTSYFIRLFVILTSAWRRNFYQKILCCLLEVSYPILNLIVIRPLNFALKRGNVCGLWPGAVNCTIRSIRNHDDDGNKNVTNLHIWLWKTIVLHALHVQFSFLTFRCCSRSSVKWPVLQLCGRRDHMMKNVQFCLLISEALVPV